MKIVLFSDTYPPEINGVATSIFNLYTTLKNHGHSVLVVTTNPFSNAVTFENDIVRIPGIELKKLYNYRMAYFFNQSAYNIIKEFKPDILHINHDAGIGQFGFIVGNMLKIPTAYTLHSMYEDYAYYLTKGHFDRAARGAVKYYIKAKANSTGQLIVPSVKIKDYLRSIGVDDFINVVPTGIDFSKYFVNEKSLETRKRIKKELGLAENDFVILSLGRVAKEKSIDICLKGYAEFMNKYKNENVKMVIVGGGPYLDELKGLASSLDMENKVIFVGPVSPDRTQDYYWIGDLFISASTTETQGLTFMEAMASSLPVLARFDDNLTGTIDDGMTGYFFFEEKDLPDKLDSIIKNKKERENVVKNALKALDAYSLEKFYENIIGVYNRAIKAEW